MPTVNTKVYKQAIVDNATVVANIKAKVPSLNVSGVIANKNTTGGFSFIPVIDPVYLTDADIVSAFSGLLGGTNFTVIGVRYDSPTQTWYFDFASTP